MNIVKVGINIVLFIVVVGLLIWLGMIIQAPIEFRKEKKVREQAVIERLIAIRDAQEAYKELTGKYAKDFNALIKSLKNDSIPQVKIIGNPDLAAEDSTYEVDYDTTMVPMYNYVYLDNPANYPDGYPVDSLRYIPFGEGEEFNLNAGEITRNRVTLQVFEASAPEPVYLDGLAERYIDPSFAMQVGSMNEARTNGNWE